VVAIGGTQAHSAPALVWAWGAHSWFWPSLRERSGLPAVVSHLHTTATATIEYLHIAFGGQPADLRQTATINSHQQPSIALSGPQRHSVALSGPQRHSAHLVVAQVQ